MSPILLAAALSHTESLLVVFGFGSTLTTVVLRSALFQAGEERIKPRENVGLC